jgi:regulator of protease activity HflC (stomatin/prohibitin superfamily)
VIAAANFLVAEKYINAIRALATSNNQKVLIVPMDLAAPAGTIAGLAEMTRAVFGDRDAAPAARVRATPVSRPAAEE